METREVLKDRNVHVLPWHLVAMGDTAVPNPSWRGASRSCKPSYYRKVVFF